MIEMPVSPIVPRHAGGEFGGNVIPELGDTAPKISNRRPAFGIISYRLRQASAKLADKTAL